MSPSEKAQKTRPNHFLEAKPNPKSLTCVTDRTPAKEPNIWKRQGRPLPSRRTPLINLITVKLSRKRCPKNSGRTCVESMLCKVHPDLYIPLLTQPTNNAPDLYHFTRMGVLCWFEVEQSRMVFCWLGWSDMLAWSDLAMIVCSDGLILVVWSDNGLVWVLVHGLICGRIWDSSDCLELWSDLRRILWAALVVWFYGLIWWSDWGRWSGLTAEN